MCYNNVMHNFGGRRTIGFILMGLGLLILVGTAAVWLYVRGADQLAIQQLPTADTSTIPLAPTPLAAAATDTGGLAIVTAIPGELPQAIPTLAYDSLPSEARADEAPRTLRQLAAGQPERLVIPTLGVDAPIRDVGLSSIVESGDIFYQWQVPHAYAVGWHHTSVPLGQTGNTVFNGHHNIYGEVFKELSDLQIGDGILVYSSDQTFVYEVTQREILAERGQPEAVRRQNAAWIQPTLDERITLISCWPYADNSHRVVIVAKPVER